MRARDIVGKTVDRIVQVPMMASYGERVFSVERIHFTDGSFITLQTVETEDGADYINAVNYWPKPKPKPTGATS